MTIKENAKPELPEALRERPTLGYHPKHNPGGRRDDGPTGPKKPTKP
jgi:hypothetical protein